MLTEERALTFLVELVDGELENRDKSRSISRLTSEIVLECRSGEEVATCNERSERQNCINMLDARLTSLRSLRHFRDKLLDEQVASLSTQ